MYELTKKKYLPAGWSFTIQDANYILDPNKHNYIIKLKADPSKQWGPWDIRMRIKIRFKLDRAGQTAEDPLGYLMYIDTEFKFIAPKSSAQK